MSLLERVHGGYVRARRSLVLSDHLAELIPRNARLLDVGCGDGLLACMIIRKRPDIALRGIDVLIRAQNYIPVTAFDGRVIPYADASFDVVMFVDVLHHTADPMILLREAVRVARKALVIKDHTRNGFLAGPTLRLMDRFGNARHGVALPYNYWSQEEWFKAWETLDLTIGVWKKTLGLYPRPAGWLFERSLHFIARLDLNEHER
jgi:SAM-dependent methyltransferase